VTGDFCLFVSAIDAAVAGNARGGGSRGGIEFVVVGRDVHGDIDEEGFWNFCLKETSGVNSFKI